MTPAHPYAPDPRPRCAWSYSGMSDAYIRYHDEEWGVPAHDDRTQFEFLVLEGAQAGLSWSTILNKRAGYREAFADFDVERVARFNRRTVERLMKFPGIVRNRLKIESTVSNARAVLELREEATSAESDALSKDLKQRGFRFVGSTIIYAHMQATGMVNDHTIDCFRHAACVKSR